MDISEHSEPLAKHQPILARNWRYPELSIEQYYKMLEHKILSPEKRYELLQGIIYELMPIGSKHAYIVQVIAERLISCLQNSAKVYTQSPVQLPPNNEPQPDIVILKPPGDQYFDRLPTFDDVLLWIEISDTTLNSDRNLKLPLCAEAGIPEFWIVNIAQIYLEVHRQPEPIFARYRQTFVFSEDEEIAPEAFPECKIRWWK